MSLENLLVSKGKQLLTKYDKNKSEKQFIICQWQEIIQSFDFGYLRLMGMLYNIKELSFRHLDKEILNNITFTELNNRPIINIYKYIEKLHIDKNYPEKEIKQIISKCKKEFEEYIINDEKGIIFDVSPYLGLAQTLKEMQTEGIFDTLLILLPEKYSVKCKDKPYEVLLKLFNPSKDSPVALDEINISIYDYVKNIMKTKPDNFVLVTCDFNCMNKLLVEDMISNVTFIYPDISRSQFKWEATDILNDYIPENEFISYVQKIYNL